MDNVTSMDGTDGSQWAELTVQELHDFVERNRWTYAKTMPKHPHEYVLLQNCSSADDFFRFVMTIRRFGYDELFFAKKMRYLDVDGRRYWTMGDLLVTTCVLNRALNMGPDIPMVLNDVPFITNPPND
jgi:hypothetical protein